MSQFQPQHDLYVSNARKAVRQRATLGSPGGWAVMAGQMAFAAGIAVDANPFDLDRESDLATLWREQWQRSADVAASKRETTHAHHTAPTD